jgi:RAB protein geranylgeranyltransferase component A
MLTAERELLPFTNGRSNEILCKLIPKYKAVNFSVQSITDSLQYHISRSPEYTNDLTDPYILERRVIDFLNMKRKSFQPTSPKITELPEHIEEIIKNHNLTKQRTKGIRQYFLGLLNWMALHDRALTDYKFRSSMDDMYPYYSINRKKGFYPLPSKVQKSWNKNYNSLLPWLKELGILVDSGFQYSPGAHICKYYEIHL